MTITCLTCCLVFCPESGLEARLSLGVNVLCVWLLLYVLSSMFGSLLHSYPLYIGFLLCMLSSIYGFFCSICYPLYMAFLFSILTLMYRFLLHMLSFMYGFSFYMLSFIYVFFRYICYPLWLLLHMLSFIYWVSVIYVFLITSRNASLQAHKREREESLCA